MVYEVERFKLIGLTIFLYQKIDYLSLSDGKLINNKVNKPVVKNPRLFYVEDLKELQGKDIQVLNREENLERLPYFADVTQDIPGYLNIELDTYKNCQLLTETHGGYLQFFDFNTKETHRIALNSNTYEPVK